jgi:predicted PhzF superfamily epimerase YddE/YHI9
MDTLGKRRLTAMACSRRSGRLTLEVVRGDDGAEQVHIGGTVAFFMDGTIYLR